MTRIVQDSIREAAAGAFAGAVTKTAAAPLDRLKLVVQLRGSLANNNAATQYEGPWAALRRMIQQEGVLALWRGNVSTILINCGTFALNFMFMDWYKKAATHLVGGDTHHPLAQSLVSGFLAGGTAITLLYPVGLARTKLALDMGQASRTYPNGMRDVLRQSWRVNGLRGWYKGYGVAVWSVSLYRAVHLGGYDYAKTWWLSTRQHGNVQDVKELPLLERLAMAQAVSMLASTVHYPLDSVRRRLSMQSDVATNPQYRSAWHCLVQIYQTEGVTGYYRGLGTTYIRSVSAALLLVSYDFFKGLLS